MEKFYITTTIPYVNAAPHLGFALESVIADAIARYHRIMGDEVVFNTGTDEHGLKVYRKALENNEDPQAHVDRYAAEFEGLKVALNLSYTNFIRTSDPKHKAAAQEFWKRCAKDIEKRVYEAKYCVGCELEKTNSELVDDRCPLHPTSEIELIKEENYFFKFSNYQEQLLALYRDHPELVLPHSRLREIERFTEDGLKDFSISRLKSKLPWGVEVPGDPDQVMYVWFDALVNYISTLGWPEDENKFKAFWPGVQIAGKDNLRQQAAMWQAMLISAGLPVSKQILIHGFITSAGEKMSKSVGNVIDPFELVERYGTDAARFWLLKDANTFEDSDFTYDKFEESYQAHLANGLGNLVSRIVKMAQLYGVSTVKNKPLESLADCQVSFDGYELKKGMEVIWDRISKLDHFIQETEPFKKIKEDKKQALVDIEVMITELWKIAYALAPFLPETSEKILNSLETDSELAPLFPRLEK